MGVESVNETLKVEDDDDIRGLLVRRRGQTKDQVTKEVN